MPKNKFQEVIFTIIMVFFMVYAMICYNTALNIGEMKNEVFLSAFKELSFMGPIAFILDFFIIGHIAKKLAFKIVNPAKDNPFFLVLAISAISVIFMCPLMSLAATLIFKNAGVEIISVWLGNYRTQLSYGTLLAVVFCRPDCQIHFQTYFQKVTYSRQHTLITQLQIKMLCTV